MATIGKGPAPYGFRWKGGDLQIDPAEAEIRRRAFELFRELKSKAAVARRLDEAGASTRRAGRWSDMQIGRILTCPSAIGRYVFNKTTGTETASRVETVEADRLQITCKPIVSRELWDEVQAALQSQATSSASGGLIVHPLVGLAYCRCGQKMRVPSGTPKYVCPACQNKIPIGDLEGIMVDDLIDFIGRRPDFAEAIADSPKRAALRASVRETESALAKAKTERSKVETAYLEGRVSSKRFGELYQPLDSQIEEQAALLTGLQKKLAKLPPLPAETAVQFSRAELARRWPGFPPATRRRIVGAFVERIVVGDGDIEICYWFGDSPPKDVASGQQTNSPTNETEPEAAIGAPLYMRLPKPRKLCELSGLSRAKLNELILPCKRNNFRPPVESKSLRGRFGSKGARLIVRESLLAYLRAQHA